MANPRNLLSPVSQPVYYHCLSRVVDRRFVFEAHERDVFRKVMRQVEAFSGVRVVTWTILSNHFHLLLEVPPRPKTELSDEEILGRCRELYSPEQMIGIEWEFENARKLDTSTLAKLRQKFLRRMWDLSEFMKTVKQKFTVWFNTKHAREGTLWERRFKSILVEGSSGTLLKIAAYIDLNAVRAGIVSDPKDYHWCGYAEAVAGDQCAQNGFTAALDEIDTGSSWREASSRYRKILFGIGEGTSVRQEISTKKILKVWESGGKLTLRQLLRCRLRYFSDGMAIGSESFIEKVFTSLRNAFGENRQCGSRKMIRGDWGELRVARGLRIKPIDPGDSNAP